MGKLLKYAGAYPFLIAVFLNAFVDLGHKITVQNTLFKVYDGQEQVILTAILNGLILLPFILLFSPAGFISDKLPKTRVMKLSAWAAVGLTVGLMLCYALSWFWAAFALTFLLSTQSAFYSPAKFAYIKVLFGKQHLAEGNGIVQAVSIVSILAGTFAFSILFEMLIAKNATDSAVMAGAMEGAVGSAMDSAAIIGSLTPVGFILFLTALLEAWMVNKLPQIEEDANSEQKFDFKAFAQGKMIRDDVLPVWQRESIRLSVIGLAMFWSVGQVMLAAFPAFAKAELNITNAIVVQGIVAASGLGIAIGAWMAGRFSHNYIETGLIPVGAAGVAGGLLLLPYLPSPTLLALDFFFIGTMGGIFIVPLNSLIQFYAGERELGRVLAGKNLFQNLAMISFLLLSVAFSVFGLSSKMLLIVTAIFAVVGSVYTVYKLPQSLLRFVLSRIMSLGYRLHVQGMKNIPEQGGVLLLGNHISWIDWAIVQLACPRPVRFVMIKSIYERWYLNWFFKLFGCVPISQGVESRRSLDIVTELLDKGQVVCLFPEGGISRNGQLAQFRRGFEHAASQTESDIKILPFYLRGLWGSAFSRASSLFKRGSKASGKRDIVVAFGEPQPKSLSADEVKQCVFELSISSWNTYVKQLPGIGHAWIDSVKRGSQAKFAIADTTSSPLSAERSLAAAICLARHMTHCENKKNVGVLLPTSIAGALSNMALLLKGKTLINLNYSASEDAFSGAVQQADISTIYSSRKFEKKLAARGINFENALKDCEVIYLEDVFARISTVEKVTQLALVKLLPAVLLKKFYCKNVDAESTAVILFSSGSEGSPKGVKLSHQNIMANVKQVSEVLNAEQNDVVMASLPLFHAFGLTITQFLPLIEGIPMVCHPDPTDALGVSKAIANYRATMLFGTSTFFRLYIANKKIHPLMLESLRFVVAGAEKLNPEIRAAFEAKFKKAVLEGYGATETTPVASVNLPDTLDMSNWKAQVGGKVGTVGMPVPGTSFRIVDPNTFEELPPNEAGMILIGGVQVMQGYLNNQAKTDEVIKEIDGTRWYVTGDKGKLDQDGFLSIVDRYSRFAKIGGEMVALTSLEASILKELSNDDENIDVLAVSLPDPKKGEKIVLLSNAELDLKELRGRLSVSDVSNLAFPSALLVVEEIPKLGSGKPDFASAKRLASKIA